MNKKLRNSINMILSISFIFSMVACGKSNKKTNNKNTLYVGVYDSGVDASWVDVMEKEYEKIHPSIDIKLDKRKSDFEQQYLKNTIETDYNDMYITHILPIKEWAEKGYILNINDVMKSKASEEEAKTIEEKCSTPNILDYFKGEDGNYYGIPFYSTLAGAVYDVDLFEQKGLYFKEGGGYTGWDEKNKTVIGKKTVGRDGIEGTTDDGLPVTYDDFKKLCDDMVIRGITPFTWSYLADCNKNNFIYAIIANYEGLNDFNLNYTFDGIDSEFGQISLKNANVLLGQKGKEYAVEFVHDIIKHKNEWFKENECYNTSQSHILSQESFLYSRPEGEPTAMILEGGWWENEANKTGIFEDVADEWNEQTGDDFSYGKRKFALMPIPLYDENHSKENVLFNPNAGTSMVINAKTNKADLAKDFLRFISTKEAMILFNKTTGQPRPFEYELSEKEISDMTYFSQSLYRMLKVEDNIVANTLLNNPVREAESNYFYNWFFKTKVGNNLYSETFNAFYRNPNLTVKEFMEGSKEIYSTWDNTLSKYL